MNSIKALLGTDASEIAWRILLAAFLTFLAWRVVFWFPRRLRVRLGGLSWTREQFVAGWLITGGTGTGKTLSGVVPLMHQVFQNEPNWGGLVIDDKGHFHQTITEIAAHYGRADDVILLRPGATESDEPVHRLNLTGDPDIPVETYARMVVDTGIAMGQRHEQSFFRTQTRDQIAAALQALRVLERNVTLESAYDLLLNQAEMHRAVVKLKGLGSSDAMAVAQHFEEQFLKQPAEQIGGIRGSVANYLSTYLVPEVAALCQRDSTFSFSDMDRGKIICVALPQKHAVPRRYVNTFLKQLFYNHALRRFDLPREQLAKSNLLVLWADEAQHFVTDSEEGLSDYNAIDRIREANATVVLATQSKLSFIPPLGREKTEVVCLNLRNRLVFQAASEADAQDAADFLGKEWRVRANHSTGRGGRQTNWIEEEVYRVKPHVFRSLRPHECMVIRCDKKYRRVVIPPLLPDGRIAPWFPWWRRF